MAKYGVDIYGEELYGPGTSPVDPVDPSIPSLFLGHQFNINRIDYVQGSLQIVRQRNQFDEFGDIVSLRRLRGEENADYRRRIQDAMVNYANSSYRGMVYGVTRELGLSVDNPILINPRTDINGNFLAPDPYIRFEGPYVYLYSDYANGVLDWAIDRFEPGGNYEHIGSLIDFINTTGFFEASISVGVDSYARSMTILNQSNRRLVTFERVQVSTVFALKHQYIVPGTLFFSNRAIFRTEMDTLAEVVLPGQYYVDYRLGIINVFTLPSRSDIVRYQYTEYPFTAIASPVIIHDITNENFKTKMFEQVLLDDGTYTHGLPTEIGADIINELMSVVPMYFGI